VVTTAATILASVGLQVIDQPLRTPLSPAGIVSFELAGSSEAAGAMVAAWDATARQCASLRSHSENTCRWIRRRFCFQVASDVREWAQRPMTEQKTHLETEDTRKQGMYFPNGF